MSSEFECCLVYKDQLELLLNRCFACGELPRAPGQFSKKKPLREVKRNITWTITGTNVTASWYCSCNGGKNSLNWAAQPFIDGTKMRSGNLAVSAAMTVAPIDHTSMDHFAKALNMPFFTEALFHDNKRHFVNPVIEQLYEKHRSDVLDRVIDSPPKKLDIAIDAQYDSPGYSADLACETMMDINTRLILTFAITHKSEVDGVSNRMELHGAKKVVEDIQEIAQIDSVTTDKHAGVIKYLRESNINHQLDLWHILHRLTKRIRTATKRLTTEDDKQLLCSLKMRLMTHIWKVIDLAEDDTDRFVELVFSFFPHIIGVHTWSIGDKFKKLFKIADTTKVGKGFRSFTFRHITACPHEELDEEAKEPLDASNRVVQILLELLSSTIIFKDLGKVKSKSATSAVESYHSTRLRYAPKRKYFSKPSMEKKTMLSVMHWNTIQMAELEGNRKTLGTYESYSKPRGENRLITRRQVVDHLWKREIVNRSIQSRKEYTQQLRDVQNDEDVNNVNDEEIDLSDMSDEEHDFEGEQFIYLEFRSSDDEEVSDEDDEEMEF